MDINQGWGFSEIDRNLAMDWDTCPLAERARQINWMYTSRIPITLYFKDSNEASFIGCRIGAMIRCNYSSDYKKILELFAKIQELK